MRKYIIISVIAIILIGGVALAKEYITGYDVNNNFKPVQVEKGLHVPGISLYPYETKSVNPCQCPDMLGGTTQSNWTVEKVLSVGGVEERWIEGTCGNATTTPIQVKNPWGDTAYVDKFLLILQNGTTSITFDIGTSSVANNSSSEVVADDVSVATSVATNLINTSGVIAGTAAFSDPGTNSQDVFKWVSGEYLNMIVTEVGTTGGVTGGANTFSCTYKIHSFK